MNVMAKQAIPVKMLNIVIRVNPVAGIENNSDAKYVTGRTAKPNTRSMTKVRPVEMKRKFY